MKLDRNFFIQMKAECINYNLRTSYRRISRIYDEIMKPSGISAAQFFLLGHIFVLKNSSINQLAVATELDRTTLSRNLKILEKMDFISLGRGNNLKTKSIVITAAGEEKLGEAIAYWQQAQDQTLKKIGENHWSKIKKFLLEL